MPTGRLRVGVVDDADCVLDVHEVRHGRVPAQKTAIFLNLIMKEKKSGAHTANIRHSAQYTQKQSGHAACGIYYARDLTPITGNGGKSDRGLRKCASRYFMQFAETNLGTCHFLNFGHNGNY